MYLVLFIFLVWKLTKKNQNLVVLLVNVSTGDEYKRISLFWPPELRSHTREAELHEFTPFDILLNAFSFWGGSFPHKYDEQDHKSFYLLSNKSKILPKQGP